MNISKMSLRLHEILVNWQQRLSKKQFTFLLALTVGATAGSAAIILKKTVHFIFKLATENKFSDNHYISLLLPMVGIALTYLIIQRVLGGTLTKGLSPLHFTITQKSSRIPATQMYAHLITSPVTVGFGGSAGLEAPIVLTGAALGSNFAKYFRLNYADRTLLLACGVAAGIASAFNAPIAGVLFTIEVLLLDISTAGFIPLLMAAALGALLSKMILDEGTILSFANIEPFHSHNVPFYIILGILAGLISIYYTRVFAYVEHHFGQFSTHPYLRIVYAGAVLALLIGLFPSLYGEGYSSIKSLAAGQPADVFQNSILQKWTTNEWILVLLVGVVTLTKAVATGATLGGGGNGGNFAPSLFVGSYLGFFYAKIVNMLQITSLPESNFTIVGMAGVLSGLYHAPLTGIFLIAELTGGYALMIPLMLVASISYLVAKSIEPHTMDTKALAQSKKILSGNKDSNILVTMKMEKLIERNFIALQDTDGVEELISAIILSERNIFPIVDAENRLLGIILLNDVKNIIFKTESKQNIILRDLMKSVPDVIDIADNMPTVVNKFEETQAWNLPVVDADLYVGFISKSKLFSSYRDELIHRTIG